MVIVNWIEMFVGLWILISPWVLGFSDLAIAKWSSVLCGLALVVVNAWLVFEEEEAK